MQIYKTVGERNKINVAEKFMKTPTKQLTKTKRVQLNSQQNQRKVFPSRLLGSGTKQENNSCNKELSKLLLTNHYIRVKEEDTKKYEPILRNYSTPKKKRDQLQSRNKSEIREKVHARGPGEGSKERKFCRKSNDSEASNKIIKFVTEQEEMDEEKDNIALIKLVEEKEKMIRSQCKRIQSLSAQIESMEEKMGKVSDELERAREENERRNKKIEELQSNLQLAEEQKRQISATFEDIISEESLFKNNSMQDFNEEIDLDLASTAYFGSLGEMEEELHSKSKQIFQKNQIIEKLKMKLHFQEMRNNENMKRCCDEWEKKFKAVLENYKTLKNAFSEKCFEMERIKIKEKTKSESEINLSLSMSQSHYSNF